VGRVPPPAELYSPLRSAAEPHVEREPSPAKLYSPFRDAGEPHVGQVPPPANLLADALTARDTIFVVTSQDECSPHLSFRIRFSSESLP
jgi:hypothetical protein